MARITRFEAGHCTHPACVALRGAGWRACRFPSHVWLIEAHGQRWLWDTGYASHFYDHTRHGVFRLYRTITPVYFDASESIVLQLASLGLRARDLDAVILSHFHGDHIAGLRDLPGPALICSSAGWEATRRLRGWRALRRGFVPGLMPDDTDRRLRFVESFAQIALPAALAPFERAWALPGSAGEVLLVELPGHAAGHLGAFILTETGWTLLAADAAWAPAAFRELRGPSPLAHAVIEDPAAYYRTLELLHQLHKGGAAAIALSHEGFLP